MNKELNHLIEGLIQKKLTRREFLTRASALGLSLGAAGVILSACGGGAATPAATETATTATTGTATAAATETGTAAATETATAAATSTEASGGPKILRIRMYGDVQNMDPAFYISANDTAVSDCVLQGLVTYGPNSYDIVNDLAEKIEMSEDGLTVTFKLKEGQKWHNGYGEVTAEDVKFSYERIADPNLKAAYKDDWAALDHVEVIDKLNGKIILKEPFALLWTSTLPVGSGKVLCKKFVEEIGVEKFATQILGSGPYIFQEWKPKEITVVKKNPDWTGTPAAAFDEIHYLPIEDDKAAEVALEAGELDWTRISAGGVLRYKDGGQFQVWEKPALRFRWIGMNIEHPKLKDIRVRQAIRYAIDVPSILQATYQGQADPELAIIAPGLVGHWKDAPVYQRDVEKAKSLLAEAGVSSLDLTFKCQDATEYKTWGQVAQQNLAEIGINLAVVPMDSASFWVIGNEEEAPNLELFEGNYSMEPDPGWATMWFTCDQINVWNWMRWCSKDYDDLHKQGMTTLDDKKREEIYIKMQQLWDEACISVWITHGRMQYGYVPAIKPATTPHGVIQPTFFEMA